MTRVAAIDCGTNSLRLLIVDIDEAAGSADDLERRTTIVRLGQGVDRTGQFAEEALDRTFAVLEDYASRLDALSVERIRVTATSAARDVDNRDAFVAGVLHRVGVAPEVITGDEEARLSYEGAARGLSGVPGLAAPVVVIDIGGGSTEFVTADSVGTIRGQSLDLGSVRLTERFLHGDPPTPAEVAKATSLCEQAIDSLGPHLRSAGTLVGVAGSIGTIAALALGLAEYDPSRIHHARISAEEVSAGRDRLIAATVAERRALPVMDPGRADVIAGGAIVLATAVDRLGVEGVLVSEQDLLDGIAWSLV
jgi:exopolyphosphatase/guanosine-5'-triphosphate,3'-diphosphate pyrophosphatase